MTVPLSTRFDARLLERLRQAAANSDTTPSGLAQRLVDEGLRAQEFAGVIFRDGPSGRRAALAAGPDVWEVASALRDSGLRGEAAVEHVATELTLPVGRVRMALAYYGAHSHEIDDQMTANDRAAVEAQNSWESQQRLLA